MVRQLLINNKQLRESTALAIANSQSYLKEISYLEKENQNLRDKLIAKGEERVVLRIPDGRLDNSID